MISIQAMENEKRAAVDRIFSLRLKSKETLVAARHYPRHSSEFIQMMSDASEARATSELLREFVVDNLNAEIATRKQASNNTSLKTKLATWLRMTILRHF